MKIVIQGPQPLQTIPVSVPADPPPPLALDHAIAPLTTPGVYTITASKADGSDPAQVSVTVLPPESVTILSPVDAARLFHPFPGPIRVRWNPDPARVYFVLLDGSQACSFDGADLSPMQVTTCALPFSPGIGFHEVSVDSDAAVGLDHASFSLERHLGAPSLRITPAKFYPYVRDGYRDVARVAFNLNKRANVLIVVRNRRGRVVRRVSLGFITSGNWAWNGRSNSGDRVPTGRYRLALEARVFGEVKRAARDVRVARGWRTLRDSRTRCGGCGPGAFVESPGCFVFFDWYEAGDAYLNCLGGEIAAVFWRFRVPRSTFKISRSIRGTRECCPPGGFASVGERTNRRTYVVGAGVSGFRAWAISSVTIRYAYRVRI